jgi:hypothetical protein
MKKICTLILFLAVGITMASAQSFRLNAYTQYIFRDRIDSYYDPSNYYNGRINDGFQWGIGMEVLAGDVRGLELKYINRQATAPLNYYNNGIQDKIFDLGMNYIMLGANNYFPTGGIVEPFGGAAAGLAVIKIKNAGFSGDNTITKFAWSAKLGTNVWITPQLGLKLQVDLLSAVQSVGSGFYLGTGGSGVSVNAYSTMYQWGLGGGLTFRLGKS